MSETLFSQPPRYRLVDLPQEYVTELLRAPEALSSCRPVRAGITFVLEPRPRLTAGPIATVKV